MPVINRIAEFHPEMTAWRRDIHAHPETAFEENRTADFVAKKLADWGLEVHRGLAKTGVVGTLKGGKAGPRTIGVRADMDALHIHEKNGFAHRSKNDGKMHACGHDGHTTMLLGAAKYLAETRNFSGTVHFIFQPAEENQAGGRVMVEDGLFDKFPADFVFGMHNMPGMAVGTIGMRTGPIMAAADNFELIIRGRGTHAAMPHLGIDPVAAAAQIIMGFQTIASRITDPLDSVVVSVTQVLAGDTWNVLPEEATLRGTTRALTPAVHATIAPLMKRIADGIAAANGCTAQLEHRIGYPATINTAAEVKLAAAAAEKVVGKARVDTDVTPLMAAEDFAFMLKKRPGAYVWLGNGPGEGGCLLHNPSYDFNDEILPIGASYWAALVETTLAK
ncbi:MAG: amidohydrolase [Alphaproteobacteria bacterium]|nr:amidohydrolase [Alphaproteobacteria bacterium]